MFQADVLGKSGNCCIELGRWQWALYAEFEAIPQEILDVLWGFLDSAEVVKGCVSFPV